MSSVYQTIRLEVDVDWLLAYAASAESVLACIASTESVLARIARVDIVHLITGRELTLYI